MDTTQPFTLKELKDASCIRNSSAVSHGSHPRVPPWAGRADAALAGALTCQLVWVVKHGSQELAFERQTAFGSSLILTTYHVHILSSLRFLV